MKSRFLWPKCLLFLITFMYWGIFWGKFSCFFFLKQPDIGSLFLELHSKFYLAILSLYPFIASLNSLKLHIKKKKHHIWLIFFLLIYKCLIISSFELIFIFSTYIYVLVMYVCMVIQYIVLTVHFDWLSINIIIFLSSFCCWCFHMYFSC